MSAVTNLDPADFEYPRRGSVQELVLADLLMGRSITAAHCWKEHGSSRLSHHAFRLKRLGWPVECENVAARTSAGRLAYVGLYRLPSAVIAAAGERGQAFVRAAHNQRSAA